MTAPSTREEPIHELAVALCRWRQPAQTSDRGHEPVPRPGRLALLLPHDRFDERTWPGSTNDAALGSYDPRVRCCYGVVIKPSAGLAKCHAGSTSSVDPKV